jgi:MYXO-CTERM domain-containing protein
MSKRLMSVAVLAVVLAMVFLGVASAGIVETTVVTDADAFARGSWGTPWTLNYGASTVLRVAKYNEGAKAYFHFDLAGLNPNWAVTSAVLKAKNANQDGATYQGSHTAVAIMPEAEDWDLGTLAEGTGTGQNLPGTLMATDPDRAPKYNNYTWTDYGSLASSKTRSLGPAGGSLLDLALDVTPLIQWALGQNAAYSDYDPHVDNELTISLGANSAAGVYMTYYSREYTSGNDLDAPRLEITQIEPPPVAEPAGLGLMGLALLGLRRRRS